MSIRLHPARTVLNQRVEALLGKINEAGGHGPKPSVDYFVRLPQESE